MKKKIYILTLLAGITICGCSNTTMVSITPDPVTGKMTRTTYTKYYDGGTWLVCGQLGMSVVVDQVEEFLGKVTIYAWNRDKEPHELIIEKVTYGGILTNLEKNRLIAVSDERSGVEVGYIKVSNYSTTIDLKINYKLDGISSEAVLTLERRTPEEMKKYFGKYGIPPYPWYHDNVAEPVAGGDATR